jgi:hypothetical protein
VSRSEPGVILGHSRDRVEVLFNLCTAGAFLKTTPPGEASVTVTRTFRLIGTDAERKMQAYAIVLAMEATARYEGGYYCASILSPDGSAVVTELEFVPPIPLCQA